MGLFLPNVYKLSKKGDTEALKKCLSHKNAAVRLDAFNALKPQLIKDSPLYNEMKKLIDDPDPTVRTAAVFEFTQQGESGILNKLKDVVINGSQKDKINALRLISMEKDKYDISLSNLLALAINDKKDLVRIEAARSMGDLKDVLSIRHLKEALSSMKSMLRLEAARALGKIGYDDCVDPLIGALSDNVYDVRRAARESLESIGTEKAMKALNDAPLNLLVERMNKSVSSRIETIKEISRRRIKQGYPLLRTACGDEYKNVRIEAVKALGLVRDLESFGVVARMIDDTYYDVRLEAAKSLEKMNDPRSLPYLEKAAANDSNRYVREAAQESFFILQERLESNREPEEEEDQ